MIVGILCDLRNVEFNWSILRPPVHSVWAWQPFNLFSKIVAISPKTAQCGLQLEITERESSRNIFL